MVKHNKKALKKLLREFYRSTQLMEFLKRKKLNGHPNDFSIYDKSINRMMKWLKAIEYIVLNGWVEYTPKGTEFKYRCDKCGHTSCLATWFRRLLPCPFQNLAALGCAAQ